ncbi:RmlC-like cupin [Stipitochalara longipes BDJ]|nr:RmlC-like cupin [Stipitochalara longipes BDJ]
MSQPTSIIIPGGTKEGASTAKVGSTFTGDVWLDMIYGGSDLAMANVTFTPCARTHWHTHEKGQVLHVIQGAGWVCDKGGEARRIKKGDIIWAPAGTTHWHGADDGTLMSHLAIGLGETKWLDAVTDEQYKKRSA